MATQKGFTLVELLVVISIMAILAVIGSTVFSGVQKGARDAKRKADINAIAKAYEVKYSNTGSYEQPLQGSDFTGGVIPQKPEGGSYDVSLNADKLGFQVCVAVEGDATPYCRQSLQGIYTPPPTPTPTSTSTPTPTPTSGPSYIAFTKPILINATSLSTYRTSLTGSLIARGIAFSTDFLDSNFTSQLIVLQTIKAANDPKVTDYWMTFGSYVTVQNLTSAQVSSLQAAGVTTLEYNPEGAHTPANQMSAIKATGTSNSVAIFAKEVKGLQAKYGLPYSFKASWAPLRTDADTSQTALPIIYNGIDGNNGMDGLILQEQLKIPKDCAPSRTSIVKPTFDNHKAAKTTGPLAIGIQIMSSWCGSPTSTTPLTCNPSYSQCTPNGNTDSNPCGDDYANTCCSGVEATNQYTYQHCDNFADQVDQLYSGVGINNLAVWVFGAPDTTNLVNFVQALRKANP